MDVPFQYILVLGFIWGIGKWEPDSVTVGAGGS
jgi:hypothetical protein